MQTILNNTQIPTTKTICRHYSYGIFLKCHKYDAINDKHLHCGRCGLYLRHSIKLSKAIKCDTLGKSVYIYDYNRLCLQLTSPQLFNI